MIKTNSDNNSEALKNEKKQLEKKLWDNYLKDRNVENRNALLEFYTDILHYIAGRVAVSKPPNVEYEDLISYGVLGLIDAIEKFDVSKNLKFSTYASMRIKGAILDALREFDWVPRMIRIKAKKIQSAYMELENRLGYQPTDEEVASYLNLTLDQFYDMLLEISGTSQLSLDSTWLIGKDADEITIMETIEAPFTDQPDLKLTREEIKKEIMQAINSLPEKER
ncbi:MAG TPA: sigma-70 family RNA polymerase sigma factor, partial [bacterium]|nr:sigma-70 family RNA polymerase sigma factor [bacterium]